MNKKQTMNCCFFFFFVLLCLSLSEITNAFNMRSIYKLFETKKENRSEFIVMDGRMDAHQIHFVKKKNYNFIC